MSQAVNQFSMAALKGKLSHEVNPNTIAVQIVSDSSDTLVPGDAVTLKDVAGKTILVDKSLVTEVPLGFVIYTSKKSSFTAGDICEVALVGSIIYAEAEAAVARGASLEFVATGTKVKTNAGTNPISAVALDKAATDGDLIRIMVRSQIEVVATITGSTINSTPIGAAVPAAGAFTTLAGASLAVAGGASVGEGIDGHDDSFAVFCKRKRVSLEQANAGIDIVDGIEGKKLRLVDCKVISIGGAAAATSDATGVAIKSEQASSGVDLFEVDLAQLTENALNRPGTASTKILNGGASFVANDAGEALTFEAVDGTDLITATHFDVEVSYAIEE